MAEESGSKAPQAKARLLRSVCHSPDFRRRFSSAHVADGDAEKCLPERHRVILSKRARHDLAYQLGCLRPQLLGPWTPARPDDPEAPVNYDAPPIEEVTDFIHLECNPLVVLENGELVAL